MPPNRDPFLTRDDCNRQHNQHQHWHADDREPAAFIQVIKCAAAPASASDRHAWRPNRLERLEGWAGRESDEHVFKASTPVPVKAHDGNRQRAWDLALW